MPSRKLTESSQRRTKLAQQCRHLAVERAGHVDGDVVADMTSTLDGKVLGTAVVLRCDSVSFRDGVASKFGEQVIGAKAGDKRTVDVQLTEAVANDQLRGKSVKALLEVKDVKSLRLPELTDEFLQETFSVPSLDQFA